MTDLIYDLLIPERMLNTCECLQEISACYSLDILQADVPNPGIVIVIKKLSIAKYRD